MWTPDHRRASDRRGLRYPRTNTKQAQLVALMHRPQGATIDEIATATGWQNHSVRGAISGALKKRLGLKIASGKEKRGRVYRIAATS
jgi:hypothetical protein